MSEGERELAYCHACGAAMDVTEVAPFSNVACPACGKHTRVKREFGPYTLLRRHAIGGMSFVFVAHDNALDREVAVKILNEKFSADEKRIAAFEKEARLTASISHPHVVRLLTTGRAFGHYYLAMEFVSGGHLEHLIRERGALPEAEVLQMALQVADGLRAAQVAGLIHRDVKPGNILFDDQGNAKIVDFGLALVTQEGHAKPDEVWATPYYVPPEAVDGKPEDFRSDLYAFGATLYHALAGKPPCSEESMSTSLLREAKRKVVPLDQTAKWLNLETCAVIDRLMAYDPAARFTSYEELIASLQGALQRARAGPRPATAPLGRQARRAVTTQRRWDKLAVAIGVLLVAGALAFGAWWMTRSDPGAGADGSTPNGGSGGTQGGTTKPPAGDDPEATLRVGKQYQDARAALDVGDLVAAEAGFAAVRDARAAKEPTATWAGFEAALAALLDGRGDAARTRAREAVAHVEAGPGRGDPLANRLAAALERLGELPSVPAEEATRRIQQADGVMVALLFAVKNWEQGKFAEAAVILTEIKSMPVWERDEWLAPYRAVVDRYLADAKVLEQFTAGALPGEVAKCQELAAAIDAAVPQLQTKGRARLSLRGRVLELARHRKALAEQPVVPNPSTPAGLAAALPKVREAIGRLAFTGAAEQLKALQPADDTERGQRDALLYLAEAAGSLLAELEEDAAGGTFQTVSLSNREGNQTYDKVAGSKTGGLLLARGAAAPVFVPWADLAADAVIDLYKRATGGEMKPLDKLRRHEEAIAYEFLVGSRQRAETAAARLAEKSPAFGARWNKAVRDAAL
jgi:hypothetical protein